MSVSQAASAVIAWLEAEGQTAIFGDQGAPRPALPYVVVRLTSKEVDFLSEAVIEGTQTVLKSKNVRLVFEMQFIHGTQAQPYEAFESAFDLRQSLQRTDVKDAFCILGFVISDIGTIQNITVPEETGFSKRATFTLSLATSTEQTDTVDYAETVVVNNQEIGN